MASKRGACYRVTGYPGNARECYAYETSPTYAPACLNRTVPRIYHAVGRDARPPYLVRANAAANPGYRLWYRNDTDAAVAVRACGKDVAAAYQCFRAPAYRADVYRFCALYRHGGVYLDTDLALLTDLDEVYSPCADVTMGYDFPWAGPGKQMKILAGVAGAPLFRCMLDAIVANVRARVVTPPLGISGPTLLHTCYKEHGDGVALTYIDTRGANWPYSGMRRGTQVLAYEVPSRRAFGVPDATFYASSPVYTPTCTLTPSRALGRVPSRFPWS
jgi:hypothetical protein